MTVKVMCNVSVQYFGPSMLASLKDPRSFYNLIAKNDFKIGQF